jgi:predicted metalloprotease with PDZ domain
MINFKISCSNPASQFLEIDLNLQNYPKEEVLLQLPAWRAGRYQLANYAQNIRKFSAKDEQGNPIPFKKITKDLWAIYPSLGQNILVRYEYWAGKMDAGSAWADDQQVYVNLVNCCFEVLGQNDEDIEVYLSLPEYPKQLSTLIPCEASSWKANSYQMLADSTILAAKSISHWTYQVEYALFHIWIHGEVCFDKQLFLHRFEAFSKRLIEDFGEFPEEEYHFIFQLLPYPHYHGVEHRRGTVITFGPAESLSDPHQMEELLGISCHELYHAWNVCRIRPKELLPYDFSKEAYTQAGLVLEGVTTYMGDLYLLKSGVYDLPTYLKHLQKIIEREAQQFGWKNYTILESSQDLWLDGYVPGIPDRKVNIYSRGALLALGIDLMLIKNGSSLPQIMKILWEKFGKPFIGYSWKDFENLIMGSFSDPKEIQAYFSDYIYGNQDLFPTLKNLLTEVGLEWSEKTGENTLLHSFGIRTNPEGRITQIHPEANTYNNLMVNDKILNYSLPIKDKFFSMEIDRLGRRLEINLRKESQIFYPEILLKQSKQTTNFELWAK